MERTLRLLAQLAVPSIQMRALGIVVVVLSLAGRLEARLETRGLWWAGLGNINQGGGGNNFNNNNKNNSKQNQGPTCVAEPVDHDCLPLDFPVTCSKPNSALSCPYSSPCLAELSGYNIVTMCEASKVTASVASHTPANAADLPHCPPPAKANCPTETDPYLCVNNNLDFCRYDNLCHAQVSGFNETACSPTELNLIRLPTPQS